MLPSSKRLTTALFKKTIDNGRSAHSQLFILKLIKEGGPSRFSVSVSKKVAKKAVERNKIRRRAYSAISSFYPAIKHGIHGVVIAKNPAAKASLEEIISDIKSFFVKSGHLK
ncbi:MAG: ribonuclease P protein component [bacterium]|nr:ribonuclease P protein component [bacterium]